ncbi:hypothetical protein TRFO_41704 [Tritrichomonas foetus]|uniref:Uncharacterized protein n=1 Tax=Tritrichomonas foetus TaxID=1144522 RepID=A0A1J4L3T0_9EUKA|nr:hypothetical protein TRFO_41704 [Tritrichomonas foetus]|eukprot:OHT16606.1 hypothetical protein TRFO_41704 [Tritrichomonas foetus]
MIDISALKDNTYICALTDGFKVVAANLYGGYEVNDLTDRIIVNSEIILTIIINKTVARSFSVFVPYFKDKFIHTDLKRKYIFFAASGVVASSLSTIVVYPLQVYRAKRKAKLTQKDGEPIKEVKPSVPGALMNFAVNVVPATVDVAFNYTRDHAGQIVVLAIAAAFAGAQYAFTGGYRKIAQRIFPKALP